MENLVNLNPKAEFWSEKRVLVTGHTGFKGSWLCKWLDRLDANILGVGLEPNCKNNLFVKAGVDQICESRIVDINNYKALLNVVTAFEPQVVFHMAAQPLVLYSYENPLETFSTNVLGSANLLQALRSVDALKCLVMVTTDKVYKNREWLFPYREEDELGGHDPYSASKACNEILVESFRKSFFSDNKKRIVTARAGNVIGGGDWSRNRLLPDIIKAWSEDRPVEIRNPEAIRPWQHVLDSLCGYLILAEKLWDDEELGGAYNFGPPLDSFQQVASVLDLARYHFGKGEVRYLDYAEKLHEAKTLKLDGSKSASLLGYRARWTIGRAVQRTVDWYKSELDGSDAASLCEDDILQYESDGQINADS